MEDSQSISSRSLPPPLPFLILLHRVLHLRGDVHTNAQNPKRRMAERKIERRYRERQESDEYADEVCVQEQGVPEVVTVSAEGSLNHQLRVEDYVPDE